ncbi:prepilin-type N-terminal cleavage/methylation domain-containing protein [Candidatus Poribacteria bacterium]
MNKIQRTDGFSLVELMIVIAIIAILASIGFPLYKTYSTKTEATEAMSELGHIRTTQISYRSIGKIISLNPDPGRVKKS